MIQHRTTCLALLLLLAAALPGCGGGAEPVGTSSAEAARAYREALDYQERFQLDEATGALEAAVAADSNFAVAWMALAHVRATLADYTGAYEAIGRAWELRDHAEGIDRLRIEHAHAAYDRDRDAARAALAEMERLYPHHPETLVLLMGQAQREGDFDRAIQLAEQVLEVDPTRVNMHNLLGYMHLHNGDYEAAVQNLQRYAYYAPGQANPHDSLGEAYVHTGRYDEAIEEFREALEIDPTFHWAALHIVDPLAFTGRFDAARSALEGYQELIAERGKADEWEEQYMQLLALADRWTELREFAGERVEKLDGGEIPMEKVRAHLAPLTYWALAVLEVGDQDEIDAAMARLGEVAGRAKEALGDAYGVDESFALNEAFFVARYWRYAGQPARGLAELERAVEQSRFSPHQLIPFVEELALGHLANGAPELAVAATRRVLDAIPTQPNVNLVAARSWAQLGEEEQALRHLGVYLEVMDNADAGHPDVTEARELLARLLPAK